MSAEESQAKDNTSVHFMVQEGLFPSWLEAMHYPPSNRQYIFSYYFVVLYSLWWKLLLFL